MPLSTGTSTCRPGKPSPLSILYLRCPHLRARGNWHKTWGGFQFSIWDALIMTEISSQPTPTFNSLFEMPYTSASKSSAIFWTSSFNSLFEMLRSTPQHLHTCRISLPLSILYLRCQKYLNFSPKESAAYFLSILYLRCRYDCIAIAPTCTTHNILSILYLRCTICWCRGRGNCHRLSILYLRCGAWAPAPRGSSSPLSFNSLFEMLWAHCGGLED